MPTPKQPAQILQDLSFQHRQYYVQRVGWGIGALLLVLALFGLFGDGLLSHAHAANSAFRIEYERILRRNNSSPLELEITPKGEETRVAFEAIYLQAFTIDSILPAPDRSYAAASDIVYVFRTQAQTTPVRITFLQSARNPGTLHGQIRAQGAELQIDQFVLP
jgi:hypothetical protein